VQFFAVAKSLQGREHLEDPGADGRKILKWIFKQWEGMDWIDLVQNRTGGGLLFNLLLP